MIFLSVLESIKPVLSFYPNWDKVLRNDQVTLTCNDQRSMTFSWYKDNVKLSSTGESLRVFAHRDKDIGYYQCQGESGEKSNPVHLDVFFGKISSSAPKSRGQFVVVMACWEL